MNESQRFFVDILSRLIDAPTQFRRKQDNLPENLDEQLKQLPWSLETAIIKYLNGNKSGWFKNEPKPKFNETIFNNADESKYYSEQFDLLDYRFSDKVTPIFDHCSGISRSSRVPLSVEQWLERHGLFESSGDNPDPHFAERAFVINVLVPCCGADILEYVKPQFEVENPVRRKKYKIDFLINTGDLPIAIEVDGAEYHDPQKIDGTRFEYESERTNFIQSCGYKHYRFPARKILHTPEDCINELKSLLPEFKEPQQETLFKQNVKKPTDTKPLSKADKVLALMGILNTDEEKQSLDYSEEDIELSTTIREYVKWFRPFQLSILLAFVNAGEKNEFIVQEKASPSGLIEAALLDLKTLITFAQAFYCTEFNFPKKIIINKRQNIIHDFGNEILEIYRRTIGPDNIDNGYEKYVPYEVATSCETHAEPDLIIDISRDGRIPIVPDSTLKPDVLGNESANLSTLRARLQALSTRKSGLRNTLKPQNLEKRIIDYFARRYLRIPALYHHMDKENPKQERRQYEILKEVLQGHSVFGIMPTGQGKSVAFQLPSILLPGGAMVISPLRALMRDQIEDLVKNRGFNLKPA